MTSSLIPQSNNQAELSRVFFEAERRLKALERSLLKSPSMGNVDSGTVGAGQASSPATLPPPPATPSGADLAGVNGRLVTIEATLPLKAPLASPAFTGIPTVPTAPVNTNTVQAASSAFVLAQLDADPRLARKIPFTKADATTTFLSGSSGGIPFTKADATLTTLFLVAG